MKNVVPMTDKDVSNLMNETYAWYKKWRGKEPDADSPERAYYLDDILQIQGKYAKFEHIELNSKGEYVTVKTADGLLNWFLNVLERRVYDREATDRN